MRIAIIGGTGEEGFGLGLRLARAEFPVTIGSRDPARAQVSATQANELLGTNAVQGMGNAAAARWGEVVIISVPYSAHVATLQGLAQELAGKLVLDVVVPLDPNNPRRLLPPAAGSAAEEARAVLGPTARIVAGFQNISAHALRKLDTPVESEVFLSSDDQEAKAVVMDLAQRAGFTAWDVGELESARLVEPLTPLMISLNIRYKSRRGGLRVTGIKRG
ncbi:MAG: NADPH-dependent F420 reductase [Deinococcus sp.]|nr:NADPH-dependent F420 reductase [Deinococcus sp.]